MMDLARWLARRVWWGMLWVMRRPQVRWMQRNHIRLFPPAMRERAWENFRRQERWGRQNGLAILTWCVWAFLVSVAFTLTWLICLEMLNRGLLDVSPESLRND